MSVPKFVRNLHLATYLSLKGFQYVLKIDRKRAVLEFEVSDELNQHCQLFRNNEVTVKLLEFKERYETLVKEIRDMRYEQL